MKIKITQEPKTGRAGAFREDFPVYPAAAPPLPSA